ncbi:DUF2142 domain-containing protein [Candidatus Pantoea multigeneris]|uniref:DUF2142 domain-containing protein n=1 Tax=Candidatus Pantoea multigeneris TaxID=2608357 RepID=A0ABX0RI58_9GAMM|nr:DUF2142 domain-containing protein [Pantoea multigeneris]NIF24182.1 DUF2142 domain-containing protein [Pantoea multigeneris]
MTQTISPLRGLLAVIVVYLLFFLISLAKPPLSSPDEINHFSRSAALAQGEWVLNGEPNTGGSIDQGAEKANNLYSEIANTYQPQNFTDYIAQLKQVPFTGSTAFHAMPNVSYYLPLFYAPAAIALKIGELSGLNFWYAYQLAAIFTFTVSLALIVWAWRIYPIPPLAWVVMLLPMSLYQLFSPTIDGLGLSLALLAMSCFMRLNSDTEKPLSGRYLLLLSVALTLLLCSKINLLPMVLLPLWLWWQQRRAIHLVATALITLIALAWTLYTLKNTHNTLVTLHPGIEAPAMIKYYIQHPLQVATIFLHTFANIKSMAMIFISFIGILGALDAPVRVSLIVIFALIFALALVVTVFKGKLIAQRSSGVLLIVVVLSSVILIYLAMLAQWSPFPTQEIVGVQGRYFFIPTVVLAYAFNGNYRLPQKVPVLILLGLLSVGTIYLALHDRYSSDISNSNRVIYHSTNKYFRW